MFGDYYEGDNGAEYFRQQREQEEYFSEQRVKESKRVSHNEKIVKDQIKELLKIIEENKKWDFDNSMLKISLERIVKELASTIYYHYLYVDKDLRCVAQYGQGFKRNTDLRYRDDISAMKFGQDKQDFLEHWEWQANTVI